ARPRMTHKPEAQAKGRPSLALQACVSTLSACGILLADAWQRHAGQRILLDVPVDNAPAMHMAESMGLKRALRQKKPKYYSQLGGPGTVTPQTLEQKWVKSTSRYAKAV